LFKICDILCYSEVIRLEIAEVGEKSPNSMQIFDPQNVGDGCTTLASCIILHLTAFRHLAKVLWGGVLRPRRLERENNNNK